jgi:hypothetical protein
MADLELMIRLAHAVGHRFWFKLFPTDGVRLRDSGQLGLASVIRGEASPKWRFRLEVPVGAASDLRAADIVMDQESEVNLIELERGLFDFQAQLRSRSAEANRTGRDGGSEGKPHHRCPRYAGCTSGHWAARRADRSCSAGAVTAALGSHPERRTVWRGWAPMDPSSASRGTPFVTELCLRRIGSRQSGSSDSGSCARCINRCRRRAFGAW